MQSCLVQAERWIRLEIVCSNVSPYLYTVHTLYIHCTYIVHTLCIHSRGDKRRHVSRIETHGYHRHHHHYHHHNVRIIS